MIASEIELLNFALENGMIDLPNIQEQLEMKEKEKLLKKHEYKIWQGKNGKWYTYLPDEKKGRVQRERASKREIEDLICEFYKDDYYINDAYIDWIEEKIRFKEIQPQSKSKYDNNYNRFFKNNSDARKLISTKIKYITEDDIEDYIKCTIANMELTHKAYSDMRILINGIFKYAKKKKFTDISITSFMGDLDISQKSFKKIERDKDKQIYSESEVTAITDNLRTRTSDIRALGLLLAFETGLRIGELSGLHKTDISDSAIHVTRTEVKEKQNGRWVTYVKDYPKTDCGDRYVLLTPRTKETIKYIAKLSGDGDYVFCDKGKRIRSNAFRRKLERVCNDVGIEYKSCHKIRRAYGTMLIDGCVDESIVAEQMGHSDISTTKKYYYYSNKSNQRKLEQIIKAVGAV